MSYQASSRTSVLMLALTLLLSACGGSAGTGSTPPPPPAPPPPPGPPPPPPPPPPPAAPSLAPASPSGDGQYGTVGAPLAAAVRVVVSRSGVPAAGESVVFQTSSGGSLSPSTATSDAQGIASTTWTLGAGLGRQAATAAIGAANVTFVSAAASAGQAVEVEVRTSGGSRFVPATLNVAAGTTVRWRWVDDGHTVTSNGQPSFPGSTAISPTPQIYEHTFATPGTYTYYCDVHGTPTSGMRGTVVVQ